MNARHEMNLTMTPMARFACGRYEVEISADGSIQWRKQPPDVEEMTVEDLEAQAVVVTAAIEWARGQG